MTFDSKLYGKRVLMCAHGDWSKNFGSGVIAGTREHDFIVLRDDGTFTSHSISQCKLLPLNDCGAPYR